RRSRRRKRWPNSRTRKSRSGGRSSRRPASRRTELSVPGAARPFAEAEHGQATHADEQEAEHEGDREQAALVTDDAVDDVGMREADGHGSRRHDRTQAENDSGDQFGDGGGPPLTAELAAGPGGKAACWDGLAHDAPVFSSNHIDNDVNHNWLRKPARV